MFTATSLPHLGKAKINSQVFIGALADGLLNSTNEKWARSRKLVSRAFTYRALQSNLPYICGVGRELVADLKKGCGEKDIFGGDAVWSLLHFHGIKVVARKK